MDGNSSEEELTALKIIANAFSIDEGTLNIILKSHIEKPLDLKNDSSSSSEHTFQLFNKNIGDFKKEFKDRFGVGIRFYIGKSLADDDVILDSVATSNLENKCITIDLNLEVGIIENKFKEEFGLRVQIEDKSGLLANNSEKLLNITNDSVVKII